MYECKCCNLITPQHANYTRHLATTKHIKNEKKVIISIQTIDTTNCQSEYRCKHCNDLFSFKQSMYKHMKYRCTKNKGLLLNNMVCSLKLKIEDKDRQIESLTNDLVCSMKLKIKEKDNQIEKLSTHVIQQIIK